MVGKTAAPPTRPADDLTDGSGFLRSDWHGANKTYNIAFMLW